MGNTSTRHAQYYNALQSNPAVDIDPYEVFGISKNFEWDELKEGYRRVAKLVHPDKGGSEILFNRVTEAFKQLALEYKARQSDRPHAELKRDAQIAMERGSMQRVAPLPADASFADRFNRAFDDNKFEDDTEGGGYGHLMEASKGKDREDLNVDNIFKGKGKVSSETFNKVFDKVTLMTPPQKEVIKYKEPEALPLAKKLQFTELGGDKPDDFSSSTTESGRRGLQYTDYMKAHTTSRLVDPRTVEKKKTYRSVEEYQTARDTATERAATDEELRWRAEHQRKQDQLEADRLRRLAARDNMISQHHARVNQLFIR